MNQVVKTVLDLDKTLPIFKPKEGETYTFRSCNAVSFPTNVSWNRIVGSSTHNPENKLQPDITANKIVLELSDEQIVEYNDLLAKIRDLPVFCFSVSDLMFILEKPLIVNGKTSNDCYFYTYERLARLKTLIPNRQL